MEGFVPPADGAFPRKPTRSMNREVCGPPSPADPWPCPCPGMVAGGAVHSGRRPGLWVLLLAFLDPFSPPRRPSSSCSSSWTSRRQRAPCWPPKVLGTSQRGPLPVTPSSLLPGDMG